MHASPEDLRCAGGVRGIGARCLRRASAHSRCAWASPPRRGPDRRRGRRPAERQYPASRRTAAASARTSRVTGVRGVLVGRQQPGAGDTNETADVFVRDRRLRVTTRVSVGPRGAQGERISGKRPSISRDGRSWPSTRTRATSSRATPTRLDVFVHERRSRADAARQRRQRRRPGERRQSRQSAVGGRAGRALLPEATNLVRGDTNGHGRVRAELGTGRTERREPRRRGSSAGERPSIRGGISAGREGRRVQSRTRQPGARRHDRPCGRVRGYGDRRAGAPQRVSVGPRAGKAKEQRGGALSADGRLSP
jgi:hypothetical protein